MKFNLDFFGKLYIGLMSVYFIVSGVNALWDIEAKLARIDLAALNDDGKIAFILIYCSLMIGIGIAIGLLYLVSKKWEYSVVLATTIIASFIAFRFVGAYLVGELSGTQISFILVEVVEAGLGLTLLYVARNTDRTEY